MAQTAMHSGNTYEWQPNFRHRKKNRKIERGEFITPPRPTGRRSNYATLASPLRELTRKNARWVWTTQHETAFHAIKEKLRTTALLSYYDPNLKTEVICDGSPVGVGAMLVQHDPKTQEPRVTTYNSRSLTDVEKRYGQIERESLAIQYGCLRYKILLGRDFDVITDHKPLVTLYNNP